ncbi:MAG: Fic family protein [Caulobacterales bacterium]|jgi:fido (protein-threonine AMPylation protein)|nr:Fic family protein [Caulobacterales bacterium]
MNICRHPPDEIAVRFHHKLVAIHLFPNGNGRIHASPLICSPSKLAKSASPGGGVPSWRRQTRQAYVRALKAADAGDVAQLLAFARTLHGRKYRQWQSESRELYVSPFGFP